MKCLRLNIKCESNVARLSTRTISRQSLCLSKHQTQTQFPHTHHSSKMAKLACLNVIEPANKKQICIIYRESPMLCKHIVIKHYWDFIDWLHLLLFHLSHRLHDNRSEIVRRTKGCRTCTEKQTHRNTYLPLSLSERNGDRLVTIPLLIPLPSPLPPKTNSA